MDDKTMMENLLNSLKNSCDLMLHGSLESTTPNVHSAFTSALCDTVAMQSDVYAKMSQKGWYPMQNADAQQVYSTKQKHANQQ